MLNRPLLIGAVGLGLVTGFVACNSSDDGVVAGFTPDSGVEEASADGGDEADAEAVVEIPKPTACPASKYKTLVIVGDSISDTGAGLGGGPQQPFYRTLLAKNDDTLYPEWKGFDLVACWGLDASADVVKAASNGAFATVPATNNPSDKSILLNQVTGLPATLPGPVLVVGTIGGNDVQKGLLNVLIGTPAQQQAQIVAFTDGFGKAMAEITKADRFGAGVKVTALMTNIYDPSGGTGVFYFEPKKATCPGALGLWPADTATAPLLAQWNGAMAAEAAKFPAVHFLDMRAPFDSHSVRTTTDLNWFHEDCIHPSRLGHNAIRGLFWAGMVALP